MNLEQLTEDVVAAFAGTGLRPSRHLWVEKTDEGVCCCALGALYLREVGEAECLRQAEGKDAHLQLLAWACRTYQVSLRTAQGFVDGWDGFHDYRHDEREYTLGLEAGRRAWGETLALKALYHG